MACYCKNCYFILNETPGSKYILTHISKFYKLVKILDSERNIEFGLLNSSFLSNIGGIY